MYTYLNYMGDNLLALFVIKFEFKFKIMVLVKYKYILL